MITSSSERRRRARPRAVRVATAAVLIGLLLLLAPSSTLAHAELVSSTPGDTTTIEGTPTLIELRFSEPLTSKSWIELVGPEGSIATGSPEAGDPTAMTITPPTLASGSYSVRWTAATADGHIERGAIDFTVVDPPPTPSPSPSPSSAATSGPSPTPEPTLSPNPSPLGPSPAPTGAPGSPAAGAGPDLAVILAVAIVAIVLGFMTRILLRGQRTP